MHLTTYLAEDLDLRQAGEAFNTLGSADNFTWLKVKKNQNGRLAMSSMFRYYVQAIVTAESSAEHWAPHTVDSFPISS